MAEPRRAPNRLIHEASPYLRQHAYNPVDWYPWGEEALQKARAEDKPILLSIGYSACHWCHVMERESFENEEIAALMNRHFVNIKVDREERPDLDHIYQTICQMVTRSGGWPLTVFLTPDLKPFYVGTYFPPDDRYGRPGFRRVLQAVADAYRHRRQEVEEVADRWARAIREVDGAQTPAPAPPGSEALHSAARLLAQDYDRRYGGFGGAPKFPIPERLALLLVAWHRGGDAAWLEMVTHTLRAMALGGIYDQIGGGFHRYSVDARWAVPHFEKMLYDNALLPPIYLWAWQITGDPLFRRVVQETLAWVEREMTHPAGGFYSTQDADSEGEEGKFYVWTPEQVRAVLGPEDGDLACRHLGVTPGGNFEGGTTVLHWAAGPGELGVPAEKLAELRRRLFEARQRRVPPGTDDKVLCGWNGLMISAFAQAARVLGDPHYAQVARRAAAFVLDHLAAPDGGLLRRWKDGQAGIPGYLEDYAYVTQGLLDLYEATQEVEWLDRAEGLARRTVDLFWDADQGGFFTAPPGLPDLIHRPKEPADGATPAPGSVATLNLLRLYPFTGDESFRRIPEAMFRAYAGHLERMPWGMGSLLIALDRYLSGGTEVTVVAPPGDPLAAEWLGRLGRVFVPDLTLTWIPPGWERRAPIWEGKAARDGRPTLYVCRHFACSPPCTTWAEAEGWIRR